MLTAILSASIPAASLIVVQIIISVKQQRVQDVKYDMTIKEIKDDIARLEKKQDKHNQLIERMALAEERIKTANRRIEDLEDKVGA